MVTASAETAGLLILVVGDVMIDRYIFGETTRISPEAPVPVVRAGAEEIRAGGAANVAANVAALGVACRLLTICGDDNAAGELHGLMARQGVALDCITDQGQRTTEKIRLISGVQQIARIDHDCTVTDAARATLAARFEAQLDGVGAVIFSDYAKGVLTGLPDLLAIAARRGVPTFVDPKPVDRARYRGAFLLKPNMAEFQALFGSCPPDQIVDRARSALDEMGLTHLLITRGSKGILMVSRDGEVVDRPTQALEVFDVTGAGDTIIAALVVGLVQGLTMATAIDHANIAASIAVSRRGTYVVTRGDLEERLYRREHFMTKLVPLAMLCDRIARARETGARVVFTNGCFDVLHAGHVRLLAEAKRQGDILIVGLNSDASVRRLKGAPRPVNPLSDRAEVISGLAAVDHVVVFEDDTPLALIEALRPDVLVKGGDYAPDSIVGADVVRRSGGRVMTVPLLPGRSTTATLGAFGR